MSNPNPVYARLSDLLGTGLPLTTDATQIQLVAELPDRNYKYAPTATASFAKPGQHSAPEKKKEKGAPHPETSSLFEASEHTWLGDNVQLQLGDGSVVRSGANQFTMTNGAALTYGQILSLGGDFYGVPDSPICKGGMQAFNNAFATLDTADTNELAAILNVMDQEISAINNAILNGEYVPDVFEETLGASMSAKWNIITGGGPANTDWNAIPLGLTAPQILQYSYPAGRYLALANNNLDHFGSNAIVAYITGHTAAMLVAMQGRTDENLQLAYKMNAFADHFLTDLFAAGHLRTPRELLQQQVSDDSILMALSVILSIIAPPAGLLLAGIDGAFDAVKYFGGYGKGIVGNMLSKSMHDQDNQWGLNVTNINGNSWRAFGDAHLFTESNFENMTLAVQAVQASVNDIYNTWDKQMFAFPSALAIIPSLAPLMDPTDTTNFSPLFTFQNGKLQQRSDLFNKDAFSWTSCWNGTIALARLLSAAPDTTPPQTGSYPLPPSADYQPQVDDAYWGDELSDSTNWPPNWMPGNEVRYAVSYTYANGTQSDKSQWMDWYQLSDFAFPAIVLPAPPPGVTGWVIYRQFMIGNVLQPVSWPYPQTLDGCPQNAAGQFLYKDQQP